MDDFTIAQAFSTLSYIISIPYIYCNFLNAKDSIKHPFRACFLIVSPLILSPFLASAIISFSILTAMFLALFIFKDSWARRFSGMMIAYSILLMGEFIAVDLTYIIVYFISGELIPYRLPDSPFLWQLMLTATIVFIVNMLLLVLFVPLLRERFRYLHTKTIAMLGLPIVISMLMHNILSGLFGTMPLTILTPMGLLICLGCLFLLNVGFRDMRRQVLVRNNLENQRLLIEQQLSYSQSLEEEYNALRKWNHDIDNHYISISYLLDNGKYDECKSYLAALLDIKDAEMP